MAEKIALVTGASRGIGRAIARRLAEDGASVVVNYLNSEAAAGQVVSAIERAGGSALAARADITDRAQVRDLFDLTERRFGRPDVVVSNAGVARFVPITEATDEDFDAMFATNARAGFLVLREAARRIRDGGRVVAISSGVTLTARPGAGVYAASKAATEQLVRVLAHELGHRAVTVNSVRPGAVRTEALADGVPESALAEAAARTPLGRLGEPTDIADVVAFLASHEARWITGQALSAGGGLF